MNKQQQIEEIVSIMAASNDPFVDVLIEIMPKVAEALYNAGYRKLPDGATVLLVGKYNQALDEKTIEYFIKHNKQISKKTAEQDFCTIIKALEERKERIKAFYGVAESAGVDIAIRTVKELAKQFGIEIKE